MKKFGRQFGAAFMALALSVSQLTGTAITAQAASGVSMTVNATKKLDVALAVGSTSVDYSAFESELRAAIGDRVPAANLNIMATTSVDTSTSNDFQWMEFDHSVDNDNDLNNFIDPANEYGDNAFDSLDRHIDLNKDQGTKLTFRGYGSNGYADFMLLENNQTTNKTFQFDIKEYFAADALYDMGYFFNSNLRYDTDTYTGENAMYEAYQDNQLYLDGYLMTLEYNGNSTTGIVIYKIKGLKLQELHSGYYYSNISEAGSGVCEEIAYLDASYSGVYKLSDDLRKFRIEVTPSDVTVYYAGFDDETHSVTSLYDEKDAVAFDESSEGYTAFAATDYANLPALNFTMTSDNSTVTSVPLDKTFKTGGSDFGPIVKYGSHGCGQLTKVELSNLTMATDVVRSLNEVIREPQWQNDSSKFLVNLNEDPIEDFDNEQITGELLNRLQDDDIYYVGWCSNTNVEKSTEFLKKNGLKGAIVNMQDPETEAHDQQIQKIADTIVARYESEMGATTEGDSVYVNRGNAITLNVTGAETTNTADTDYPDGKWTIKYYDTEGNLQSETTKSNLTSDFEKPGTYAIYYCGTQEDNLIKKIVINDTPTADFTVQIASGGAISATLVNVSTDTEGNPMTCKWSYSEVGSAALPMELTPEDDGTALLSMEEGKIYLVSLTVTDSHGATNTISRQISYDSSATALPIASFTIDVTKIVRNASGDSITGSDVITVNDKSYDLYGKAVTSNFTFTTGAAITMNPVVGQDGVYTIDTSALQAGTYTIYCTANNGTSDSKRVARIFKIVKDQDGPDVVADTAVGQVKLPTTNIRLQFNDEGSGVERQKVLLTSTNR